MPHATAFSKLLSAVVWSTPC